MSLPATSAAAVTLTAAVPAVWPHALDGWFRQLLLGRLTAPPDAAPAVWQQWAAALEAHGLLAWTHLKLRSLDEAHRPPPAALDELRGPYFDRVGQAALRRRQLELLLPALKQAGVTPIVLKGAALAHTLYRRPEMRPSSDIDLLVREEDYPQARRTLLELGYFSKRGIQAAHTDWYCDEELLPGEAAAGHAYTLELHWSLSPYARVLQAIDISPFWQRCRPAAADFSMMILDPVDALVHASFHLLYKHATEVRLIWLLDIHLLAQQLHGQDDWRRLLARAQRWQAALAVLRALELAGQWFGTSLPAGLAAWAQDFPPREAELQLAALMEYKLSHGSRRAWLRQHLFQMGSLSWSGRLAYLGRRLFPSRQEIDLFYPQLQRWPYGLACFGRFYLMLINKKEQEE